MTPYADNVRISSEVLRSLRIRLEGVPRPADRVSIGPDGVEPGAGIGHFIGLLPDDLASSTRFTAVEADIITSRIAQRLNPTPTC